MVFGVEKQGAAGGSPLLRRISPRAPRFSQDHKRKLISDVEKQQAWPRILCRGGSEDGLDENKGDLLSKLAEGK